MTFAAATGHLPSHTRSMLTEYRSSQGECDRIPHASFCLCSSDDECEDSCLQFREADETTAASGICVASSSASPSPTDPCDRSQNEPYQPRDCILQSKRQNQAYECDGTHYNLDLYVKSETGASFVYKPKQCVIGYNVLRVNEQTVEQCQQLCLDFGGPFSNSCVAFEYGVDYGGKGLSTKENSACGLEPEEPKEPIRTTGPSQIGGGLGGLPAPTEAPTPSPSASAVTEPCSSTSGRDDFCACASASQCASGGCFDLTSGGYRRLSNTNLRGLQAYRSEFKTCANPASFQNSGPAAVCQFPFVFRGATYTSCTTSGSNSGSAWCSTKVDPNTRAHVSDGGFIHYCATPAPTPSPGGQQSGLQGTTQTGGGRFVQVPVPVPAPVPVPVPAPQPAPAPNVIFVPAPAPPPQVNFDNGFRGGWFGQPVQCLRCPYSCTCGILLSVCC